MADNSNIELATHTFNPWRENNGTRVVAAESAWKKPLKKWNQEAGKCPNGNHMTSGHLWKDGSCLACGASRPRVFCASMADVFEDWQGPMVDSYGTELCICHECGTFMHYANRECKPGCKCDRAPRRLTMADVRRRLFGLIDATPNLDWLLLTKRPENIMRMMADVACSLDHYQTDSLQKAWQSRVWLGTSVEDQATADERIPHLLRVPAAVRFLSCEPLLGPVEIDKGRRSWLGSFEGTSLATGEKRAMPGIDWVIVGGESGPGARPMHPEWARSLRDQCQAAGVPFFFKQWGEYSPVESLGRFADLCDAGNEPLWMYPSGKIERMAASVGRRTAMPEGGSWVAKVGKKAAGRLLDGREWNEMPVVKEATS